MSSDANATSLLILVIVLFVAFVVFLILREFFCWYWKINERVRLQTRQVNLTILLIKELKGKSNEHDPAEIDDLLKAEIEP
jgi:hypothetical protein